MATATTVSASTQSTSFANRTKIRRLFRIYALAGAALASLVISSSWASETSTGLTIRPTESGLVEGLSSQGLFVFRGIPYAAPPIAQLRWHAPLPPNPWNGVRQATQFAADCYGIPPLRRGSLAPGESEDCLYLNIWAPQSQAARKYPVMVWIYGGGFVGGTAAVPYYDGTSLARRGAIVVTFNYRTNIFGFFSHPGLTQESPTHTSGNYGLLDMLAALKWVKQNIASFGGDPNRVTVFGESAGASAIGLLLTSPMSRGLFDGAILESPGLMRPLATLSESEAAGAELGGDLSQLRAMDPKTLMNRATSAISASRKLEKPRPVGPIIDGTVLPQSDAQAIASGDIDRVPVIIGSNADEGRLFVQMAPPVKTVAEYQSYLKSQFGQSAGLMAECYPVASDDDVMPAVSRIFGDNQFNRGIATFSNALSALGQPVFRYRFDGPLGPGRKPATHGGEIPYVFDAFGPDELAIFSGMGLINLGSSGVTAEDHALSQQMSAAWINFAARRNPNGSGVPDWPAYKPDGTIMVFGSQSGAKESAQLSNACQSADRPK